MEVHAINNITQNHQDEELLSKKCKWWQRTWASRRKKPSASTASIGASRSSSRCARVSFAWRKTASLIRMTRWQRISLSCSHGICSWQWSSASARMHEVWGSCSIYPRMSCRTCASWKPCASFCYCLSNGSKRRLCWMKGRYRDSRKASWQSWLYYCRKSYENVHNGVFSLA